MINIPENKQLILFDGVCNLCNGSVQFIIRNDKKSIFLFAPLQGKTAKEIIKNYHIDTAKTDSILLYSKKDGLSTKSTAALNIAKKLRVPINALVIFFVIPKFIRNWIYDLIARKRYTWFGKQDACMIPTAELRSKFLE
jgi:predicted DCC family thiol-disulfide oxidoreductase YuxK